MSTPKDLTRREFVAGAGKASIGAMVAASAPLIIPRSVLGRGQRAPSDTVNIAVVGFGSMGSQNAQVLAQSDRIGVVCDVDLPYSERCVANLLTDAQGQARPEGVKLKEQFDKAKRYTDFREMLAKEKHIDAVLVATADHNHAVVAKTAMEAGKHVYVQKPLTATVHEARMLRELALKNPKLVTQMGNQGHSSEGARLINEWIGAGIIGPVHEVHVWTNRPVVYWPQGIGRPTNVPAVEAPGRFGGNPWTYRYVQDVLAAAMGGGGTPPAGLDWDLYLGPIAENVPYHPVITPSTGAAGSRLGAEPSATWARISSIIPSGLWVSPILRVSRRPRRPGAPCRCRHGSRGREHRAGARTAQTRVLSALDVRALSVCRARQSAAGKTVLV